MRCLSLPIQAGSLKGLCLRCSPFPPVLGLLVPLTAIQGSRLTAFELVHDKIPAILIADSAAAARMATGGIDAVVVGADRIAANGELGTRVAVAARQPASRACSQPAGPAAVSAAVQ